MRASDLTGRRFGRLVVLRRYGSKRNEEHTIPIWLCRCDCGAEVAADGPSLKYGKTKSCGCLKRELSAERGRGMLKDLTGQRFGRLVVLHREEPPQRGPDGQYTVFWVCRCDCGAETSVRSVNLRNGSTRSCGCLRSEVSRETMRRMQAERRRRHDAD